MHVVKPLHLGILHRSFGYCGRSVFAVSALIGFNLRSGEFLLEQAIWQTIGKYFGQGAAVFDAAMPKARPEVLVQGAFHAPGGRPVTAGKVAVQLGGWRKELAVFGDRHWRPGLGPSRPQPMTRMPVDYAHAFGGPDDPRNPAGIGLADDPESGQRPLPNIEDPQALIGSPSERPRPAGLAPLDQTWEPRAGKRGSYDERWLKERAPGLADDIDWSFFNDAPADQWLAAAPEAEPYLIEHMHPQYPRLSGRLPGVYGRAFAEIRRERGPAFEEIPLRLDTVWFYPEDELGVLIWRGSTAVASEDPDEVGKLLLAFEAREQPPRPLEHYREELRRRTDPEQAFRYLLNTAALIPAGVTCGFQEMQDRQEFPAIELHGKQNVDAKADQVRQELDARLAEQRAEIEAQLTAAGVDPAPVLAQFDARGPGDPQIEALQALVEKALPTDDKGRLDLVRLDMGVIDEIAGKADEIVAAKKSEARQALAEAMHELQAQTDHEGKPLVGPEQAAELLARLEAKPPFPRPIDPAPLEAIRRQVQELEAELATLRERGVPEAQIPRLELPDLGAFEARIDAANAQIMGSYRQGAHLISGCVPPHAGREAELAAELLRRFQAGESLGGGDFAGVSLAGTSLAGIDLSQALLEEVDLSGADLSGADLSGAVIVRARLVGTRLDGARLAGANLGGSDLSDARLDGADLQGAVLTGCRLERARLCDARLHDAQLLEAQFGQADFSGAELGGVTFIDADLSGARFLRARLPKTVFLKSCLQDADFSEAEAAEATFVETRAAGARFRKARLSNARFVGGAELQGADFGGAELERANLAGTRLDDANFDEARLGMAYFGEARLVGAILARAVGPRAVFTKADLGGADLRGANLMEGCFHQARLVGARCAGANLYAVDFNDCVLGDTDFSGANLDRSLLQDWRPA